MAKNPTRQNSAFMNEWLGKVDLALRTYGHAAAAQLALQAVDAGVTQPAVLNLAAQARYGEGRFDDAVQLLEQARKLAPKDAHILNSLGVCQQALGDTAKALEAYAAALRADPGLAAAHCNRGALIKELGDVKGARASFLRALEIEPNYVEPVASLAWLEAEAGDPVSARGYGDRALIRSPGDVLARMALASADLQQKDLNGAAARLTALHQDAGLSPLNRAIVLGMIGDLQDALGHPGEAFRFYEAGNAALKMLNARNFEGPGIETALEQARRLANWFNSSDPAPWRDAPQARPRSADPKVHVFLVGFPRSGTTLLENVLAAHPEAVSLEEKNCLEQVAAPYLKSSDTLGRLARLSQGEAMRQRETYWSLVRKHGVEPRARIFIDKFPLSSIQLPVVAKLFPNARILFARRDPRDVVLSCFRRRFAMNPAMYQLLTLQGAAAFYAAVMQLSELYRGLLPLPLHIVRYESLVGDFEATARAACDFLGLDWSPEMLDFAAKARARGISTPSAAQVARGLNREGQGTWRNYQPQMAPVLPLLEEWVSKFGYDPA